MKEVTPASGFARAGAHPPDSGRKRTALPNKIERIFKTSLGDKLHIAAGIDMGRARIDARRKLARLVPIFDGRVKGAQPVRIGLVLLRLAHNTLYHGRTTEALGELWLFKRIAQRDL